MKQAATLHGTVFQTFDPFPHLTVLRNVAAGPITVLGLEHRSTKVRATDL